MSYLKFNHVFAALMVLSVITGFILPQRRANQIHPEIQALFAPVASPVGGIARWLHHKFSPDVSPDKRPDEDIRRENLKLSIALSQMTSELQQYREMDLERSRMGSLKDRCTIFPVIGGDPGTRESLQIRGSSLEGLREGMFALYGDGGIAGIVQRAGLGGAQVQLITDTGFRVRESIVRLETRGNAVRIVAVSVPQALAIGIGRNRMVIENITYEQAQQIRVGDMVVADEPDWPSELKGRYLGHVTAVGKRPSAPQYAEIRIEPRETLLRLRDVLVITKER